MITGNHHLNLFINQFKIKLAMKLNTQLNFFFVSSFVANRWRWLITINDNVWTMRAFINEQQRQIKIDIKKLMIDHDIWNVNYCGIDLKGNVSKKNKKIEMHKTLIISSDEKKKNLVIQ